jgi:hypothetical protein
MRLMVVVQVALWAAPQWRTQVVQANGGKRVALVWRLQLRRIRTIPVSIPVWFEPERIRSSPRRSNGESRGELTRKSTLS